MMAVMFRPVSALYFVFLSAGKTRWNVWGAGLAQWLQCQTLKGHRCESRQELQENFLIQGQLFVLTLYFSISSTRVTTVACKRSWFFHQKYRWQVTAKHACTLHTWLCIKWYDMVHGCMVYSEYAKMAAVSCGTSHATVCSHTED